MTTPTFFFLEKKNHLVSFSQTNSKMYDADCENFFSLARDHSYTQYAYFWLSTALNSLSPTGRPVATPEETPGEI